MSNKAITEAARLLRDTAEELKNAHTIGGLGEWDASEPEVKAVYDEHIRLADELAAIPSQCLHQITEPTAQLTDAQIDEVFNRLPDGQTGFLKARGYQQFARDLLAMYAPVQPAAVTALFAARGALQHLKEGGKQTESLFNCALAAIDSIVVPFAKAAVDAPVAATLTLPLEIGKKYIRRDGLTAVVIEASPEYAKHGLVCLMATGDSTDWACVSAETGRFSVGAKEGQDAVADALSAQAAPVAPTFMTADQGLEWAWNDVRSDLDAKSWNAGESASFYGFFLHGWNYRGQYEKQRAAAVAALKQEFASAPVAVPAITQELADMLERSCEGIEHYRDTESWSEADDEHLTECRALLARFDVAHYPTEANPATECVVTLEDAEAALASIMKLADDYANAEACAVTATTRDGEDTTKERSALEAAISAALAATPPVAVGEREAFEAEFPVPSGVAWDGKKYTVQDDYLNSYRVNGFIQQWEAWQARAALAATPAAVSRQFTDGTRTLRQDCLGAIRDFAATKPEDGEDWESWFEAAFDLLGSRVNKIFDEHAIPTAPSPVVLPEPDAAIKEVMDLVSDWGGKSHLSGEAQLDAHSSEATQSECDYSVFCQEEERKAWKAIESKLHTLLAGVSAPAGAVNLDFDTLREIVDGLHSAWGEAQGYAYSPGSEPYKDARKRAISMHGAALSYIGALESFSAQALANALDAAPAASEQDAADRECLDIGRAIHRAALELPPTGEIRIELENGAGVVYVNEPKHGDWKCIESGGELFSVQINQAIDAAIAALAAQGGDKQ